MPDWRLEIERRLPEAHRAGVIHELALHLSDRYDELRATGVSDDDAYRAVIAELDHSEQLERELSVMSRRQRPAAPLGAPPMIEHRRVPMFADLWQDVRFAARMLRKSPGFAMVVILTLALGIGANTAIFTVINAVILRPLPFGDPERLVRIHESSPARGWPTFGASHPNFLDWVTHNNTFDHIGATQSVGFTLSHASDAERLIGIAVSHSFLPALGVGPAIGRNFLPEEDRPGGDVRVALLTHGFWQRQFSGDPRVLERTLVLTGNTFRVIGVLPERFTWRDPTLAVVVPLAADPARSRDDHRLLVIGRMKPGVPIETAEADLKTVAAQLEQQYPATNRDWTVRLVSFFDWLVPEESRQSLLVFGAAVIALLLIACSNVASLLLARATGRDREIAVRLALGARRGRLIRQLLVEALLLAGIAGVIGFAVAVGATALLRSLGPETLPRLDEVSIDWRVVSFGLIASLSTGILFGLLPAFTASRVDVNETLKEARTGGVGPNPQRARHVLVVAELALSVTLLIAGGLLLRSFIRVQQVEPGFETDRLVSLRLSLPRAQYDTNAKAWNLYARLLERVRAVPGVVSVATTSIVPLSDGGSSTEVRVPGRTTTTEADAGSADYRIVSPGYFDTMGIPLRGREFSANDNPESTWVTIISEAAAVRYWPGEDPLGKSVILSSLHREEPLLIVGIAGDVRSFGLDTPAAPAVYFATPITPRSDPMNLVVRTAVEPMTVVPSLRAALRELDPNIPFFAITSVNDLLDRSLGPRRFTMLLIACFAVVALTLASVGLFGMMTYLVTQRTREIGIRLALGARPSEVFTLVLGRGVILATIGVLIGVAAAYQFSPVLDELLFEVRTGEPVTFVGAPLLLVAVALIASYLPARKAMRVDPLHALRHE